MPELDKLINAENKVVGIKQLLRGLEDGVITCVYIADDADENFKYRIREAIGVMDIEVVSVGSMEVLGEVCGIDVGAACAGILKD